jgi:hypothetical protein
LFLFWLEIIVPTGTGTKRRAARKPFVEDIDSDIIAIILQQCNRQPPDDSQCHNSNYYFCSTLLRTLGYFLIL